MKAGSAGGSKKKGKEKAKKESRSQCCDFLCFGIYIRDLRAQAPPASCRTSQRVPGQVRP